MSSAVGFMHDVRVCGGCMRVNGVNGVCGAVVWRDGGRSGAMCGRWSLEQVCTMCIVSKAHKDARVCRASL
jgi:hypothetical protein